jgi:NB-ARC domain
MVRYDKNQFFTGRDSFLAQLHNKFQDPSTDPYHGRIALFGLGGIGKTQIVLEYVYRYQSSYRRIYWISADTQAALLDRYQKIAERADLPISHLPTAVEVAEQVISWLEQEESWLLVVDNLDDLNVLSMAGSPNLKSLLLPSTRQLRQHTLITTRNRYADGIPAQGMEVPKLNQEASLEWLYKSSKIMPGSNSAEDQAAARIVEDLDYLPMAIDQAAA